MAFNKFEGGQKDFGQREMIKGNWNCTDCNKEITELPFEPTAERPVYCRDCWSKRRSQKFPR